MLDFGVTERWPAKYCLRKWDELHPNSASALRAPYPVSYENSPALLQSQWELGTVANQSDRSTPLPVDAMVAGHTPSVSMIHGPNPAMSAHNPNVPMPQPIPNFPYYANVSSVPNPGVPPVGLGMMVGAQRLSPQIGGQGIPVGMARRPSGDQRMSIPTARSRRMSSE